MKRVVIGTLCVALLLPVFARADLKEGTYAPDIEAKEWLNTKELSDSGRDEPVSLAELRGMVVVLYFWVSWSRGGEASMPLVNVIENLGRRHGVFLMGVTEADRERVEDMLEGERLLFPIALESTAAKEYDIESFPHVVVIDANGKIAYSGLPSSGNDFVHKLEEIATTTPPTRTHPREAAEARRLLDRARTSVQASQYKAAFHAARSANDAALSGDALKTQCQDVLDLLEAIGRDKLADAMRLVDSKKFAEGVAILHEVSQQFRGMRAAKTANKRMKALEERYPEVRTVLDGLKHEAEGRGLLVTARDALWNRAFGEAFVTLEQLNKDYGDTPSAPTAKSILERMQKNATIMGYVRDFKAEKDCTNWLGQARSFIRTGNSAKARELLRKVIDTYPETKFREEAYRMLGQLP